MNRAWVTSATTVQDIGSQSYFKRFVKHDIHARAITGQIAAIEWSIHTFMVILLLDCVHVAAVIDILRQVESMLAIEFALDVRLLTMLSLSLNC
jgi:hypothetical protein